MFGGLRVFLRNLSEDELGVKAAAMAFYLMLSLFPALILLVALVDALPLGASVERISDWILSSFPGPGGEVLQSYMSEFAHRKPTGLLSLWGLGALWAASKGIAAARQALNRVFVVQRRRGFVNRLIAPALTLAGFVLIGCGYFLLVGGPQLGNWLGDFVGLGESFAKAFVILHRPISFALLTSFVVLALRYLPQRRVAFRFLLAGALPTAIGWIGLGFGLRLWLAWMGDFDQIYGSLASFIILMTTLWLFALLLLFGAEISAHLAGLKRGPARLEADSEAPGSRSEAD